MAENDILAGMVDQPEDQKSDLEATEGNLALKEKPIEVHKEFYRNLAEDLTEDELDKIAGSLLALISKDHKDREKRDEQYKEGLQRMGLDKETLGGANFHGASNVVHPMYTKACIDFEARSIKELFPPVGPVREYVSGTMTQERIDRAHRKAQWMNFQCMYLMPNLRDEMEQILMNLPMGGNQYLKIIPPTGAIETTTHEWIPIDKMLLPFAATNYYTAERRTHVQDITAQEFERRMRSGMYQTIDYSSPVKPEGTETEKVAARIEGKEDDSTNPDGLRRIFECDCIFEIRDPDVEGSHTEALQEDTHGEEEDDADEPDKSETESTEPGPFPYIISIDESSKKVLSIYRNWDKDDESQARLEWVVEWTFIPFRGAYALGLPHIIGGLSIAATGALRALLDSAHINNMAGLLKLKGASGTGQNLLVRPTEVTEIENSGEIDDIRKIIMPVPFGQPSSVLLTLLGILGQQAEDVIRTTIDEVESQGDVPVGTTLARIEQGMVAFSAIHGRLHRSLDRMLRILHRIDATYLEDSDVLRLIGEPLVTRGDFQTAMDVIPVSDPNIFCEVQRYGQIQTVAQRSLQLAALGPNYAVYDPRKVEELILKQMKLPNDGKDLLIPKPEPQQMNPVNENVALTLGRPIVAFPQQDHEAHINAHCDFFESPLFKMLAVASPQSLTSLMQNLKEHIVFWYANEVVQSGSREATKAARKRDKSSGEIDIGKLPQSSDSDPEVAQSYDRMLALASVEVMKKAQQSATLKRAIQAMQQIQKMLQAMQKAAQAQGPQGSQMADVQRQAQADQAKSQNEQASIQQKSQSNQQANQTKVAVAQAHEQAETQRRQMQDQTKQQTTQADNQTAVGIESMKIVTGHQAPNVSNGESLGQQPPSGANQE